MNMRDHILAAMKEQIENWEGLLARLSDEQIKAPLLPSDWSIKDIIVHLWAWQQRSNARLEAAQLDREPLFPTWVPNLDPNMEASTERINAWIYETYRELSWSEVSQNWRAGYLRLLKSGEGFSEKDLLDGGKYPWLEGYSLALVLLASYDHHQEHLDKLLAWLSEHEQK